MKSKERGFTILEVVFAASIVAFTLGAIFLTHSNTLRIVRQAHRSVNVSQILQEKSELIKGLNWPNALNGNVVSGTACLGGSVTENEQNLQSVSMLTETVQVMEYPAGQAAPTGGYTVVRKVTYAGAVPSATAEVNAGPALSSTLSKIYVCISGTYQLTGTTTSSASSGRDFEMVISNPLK